MQEHTDPRTPAEGPAPAPGSTDGRPSNGAAQPAPGGAGGSAEGGTGSSGSSPSGSAKKRRRGSRGGRARKPGSSAATAGGPVPEGGDSGVAAGATREGTTAEEYRRRPDDLPDRPGEGQPSPAARTQAEVRRPRIGDTRPAPPPRPAPASEQQEAEAAGADVGERSKKKRRRRGGRGRGKAAKPALVGYDTGDVVDLDPEELERRKGRERKGRPVGRYFMCVHAQPGVTQIAVLEGRHLIEHYVSRPQDDATQIDGNIYLGKVQNVLPGMEAAFVDIGTPKNAVLYRGDVRYDPDDVDEGSAKPDAGVRIEQLLRSGQTIVCQVTKNPIGTKGARLTQEVSLPGRFVVLIPNSETYGISKRLPDDERKRLRKILDDVKPAHHGIIVRTAAERCHPEELRRDVERLLGQWEAIEAAARKAPAPALLYREPDMAVRVIREEFNKDYRGVAIDDRQLYEQVKEYVEGITPELADRVEHYDPEAEGLALFERHHVHEQLHKALDRKVWLPSGGSLIIERTEALTVIDVNTGKNVGTSSLEETVFRNNLEAAEEVAHQLRLRDIGGIIVIDFIDMEIAKNRDEVIRVFREALARDKTRTQVFDISELGLVEMTRKRVSEGLVESFSQNCPTCNGRGIIFDDQLL